MVPDETRPHDSPRRTSLVSVVGKMGIPPSAPGITKLVVDGILRHEAITIRAFEIFKSRTEESQDDLWFRTEGELLNV